ncbi:acyltransferase family protein [Homoserinibacter sp. GY 40078]|uniref:acyltransferase family protein n=1 Tax=Homoserinibacter sp. GY 40078 TaxID=2603275 RepID=UPI00164F8048|nr:acyltransferase family protein [Homoserinibacter sp. GY 40078]
MVQQTTFRPEIQALRAIAVTAVVLFHLWPNRVTGGYVGVDVFFVISGFLITSHLLREADSSGTISLSRFYARRIRRLLPAAFLVLAFVVAGVLLLAPESDWPYFLGGVVASALYVANWFIAVNAVDYFATDNAASPIQHYWSLSVEEQFYLVWPLLILLAVALTRKRPRARRWVLLGVFGAIFVGCLTYSIVATPVNQEFVYFATPAHAWEFALGGLLAFAMTTLRTVRWDSMHGLRAAVQIIGLVLIAVPVFVFDADTIFPGWIALIPVLGTAAVIAAGVPEVRWSPVRVMSLRPVQFVGDISYAVYLWHWPLIVFGPLLLLRPLTFVDKFVIIVLMVVLSWATRRFVEVPVIGAPAWRPRRVSYVAALAATAALVAGSVVPLTLLDQRAQAVQEDITERAETGDACLGASAIESEGCKYRLSIDPAIGISDASLAADDLNGVTADDGARIASRCTVGPFESEECVTGPSDPSGVVALVGDSHAQALEPGVEFTTTERDWQVRSYTRRSCPAVISDWVAPKAVSYKENQPECRAWRADVVQKIADDPSIDVVVVSSFGRRYGAGSSEHLEDAAQAMSDTWKVWVDAGKQVVVVGDLPTTRTDVETCVEEPDPAMACSRPRQDAMQLEPLTLSVALSHSRDVTLLDLSDGVCDAERCYAAVGGLLVYEDWHHLTPAFARSLAPLMLPELDRAMRRAGVPTGQAAAGQ